MRNTFYQAIKSQRQTPQHQSKQFNRLMLAGYFNQQYCKRINLTDYQKIIKQSIKPFIDNSKIGGYLYVKGCFYLHILQAVQVQTINQYLYKFNKNMNTEQNIQLHKQIRIVYQSYESSQQLFKKWQCYQSQQSGPILIQSDKLQQQILQRSIEIYNFFQDGARTRIVNASHKIGNMILLNNQDMAQLINKQFMTLQEYIEIYMGELDVTKEEDLNYPLPPNMFKMLEFMEIQNYKQFS